MDIDEFAFKYLGYVIQPHQRPWIEFLENTEHRGLLMAPRGHGKTTTVNYIWLSWVIANNPDLRILLVSHSKDMAEKFSMAVRNVMENKELQAEFDFEESTPWRANSWRLSKSPQSKPTLECKGALGRMTGWRGDLVIFDDLLEFSTDSEANRIKLENWRNQSVLPAIDTHKLDKVIVVGTRKSVDDWYGELLDGTLYERRIDRAFLSDDYMDNEDVQTLAPFFYDENGDVVGNWWNREALLRRRAEIGSMMFEQEYMNRPAPPEGVQFKYEWLRFYEHLPREYGINYYMGIDPAYGSAQKRSSYFALCVIAHDVLMNHIYIVDFYRNKLSPEEQVQKAIEFANKYTFKAIYVEAVFQYTHVYKALRERFHRVYPIDYIHSKLKGTNVVNKEERIRNICSPPIELGKVFFKNPQLDIPTKKFINNEYLAFPYGDMDMFDALTLAIHRIAGIRYTSDVPFFAAD